MKTNASLGFRLAPIAAALLAAFGSVHAAEGDLKSMMTPDSSIEIGGGYVDSDNGNFGKYNGLNEQGGYLLLDGNLKARDEGAGTWMKLRARNLGLDSRELRWDHNRQGDWKYFFEYNEITRNEPLQVITPVVGLGSASLSLGSAPVEVDIESKRKRYSLGFGKMFTSKWAFNVDFRNETKKGERIFGHGTSSGGGNYNFTPEPFDSTIRLLDATASYTDNKFQVVGGFYGTQFRNDNSAFNWTYDATSLAPSALPPDNQSYQLYVTGGYSFNRTTRGTFKAAFTEATQDDNFIVPPNQNTRTDLGGKVETTLLQAGISARPMSKLSIIGNLRYEDRNNKTPVVQYVVPPSSSWNGFNEPRSIEYTDGKLEASYALAHGFRVIGAIEYDKRKRSSVDPRSVSHRDKTEEWSYQAALRRSMSETLTGGLTYTYSERDGSDFLPDIQGGSGSGGPVEVSYIKPYHQTDRKRDKIRLSLNWLPVDPLSFHFYVDDVSDRFDAGFTAPDRAAENPVGGIKGEQQVYAIDVAYQFNKNWQATAWYNYNKYKFDNRTPEYTGESINKGDAFGVGVRGKATSRIEVGADFSYSDIKDEWNQQLDPSLLPLPAGESLPPDATTRLTRLKLFGKYHIDKNSGLRFDYIYDRFSSNDPTWTGWVPGTPGGFYTEGTVVSQPSPQKVNFVGVRYFYNFH